MAKLPRSPAALSDYLLEHDPVLQQLSARLHRQQRRLRQAIGLEDFRLYLRIEDTANERCARLVRRVCVLARTQGRQSTSRKARG